MRSLEEDRKNYSKSEPDLAGSSPCQGLGIQGCHMSTDEIRKIMGQGAGNTWRPPPAAVGFF